jgi:hypothetical protein
VTPAQQVKEIPDTANPDKRAGFLSLKHRSIAISLIQLLGFAISHGLLLINNGRFLNITHRTTSAQLA